jgi:hypothetical protein
VQVQVASAAADAPARHAGLEPGFVPALAVAGEGRLVALIAAAVAIRAARDAGVETAAVARGGDDAWRAKPLEAIVGRGAARARLFGRAAVNVLPVAAHAPLLHSPAQHS